MDREFYEQASFAWSPVRYADMEKSVLHSIEIVSQLVAAMEFVSDESKASLRDELDQELFYLRANTAELKRAIAAQDLRTVMSNGGDALVARAERLIAAATLSKQG